MTNWMRHPFRVPRVEKPRTEGRFDLPTGRRLGYAEFGDPSGAPVLWFHGTPGGRRQFPVLGRRAAEQLGLLVSQSLVPMRHIRSPSDSGTHIGTQGNSCSINNAAIIWAQGDVLNLVTKLISCACL